MASTEVTDDSFRQLYKSKEILILDFWAIWCTPCNQFAPTFEDSSEEHPDIFFGKIETERQPKLSEYFGIRSIPTIIVIREELEVFRHSGTMQKKDITELIQKIKDLNMDEVRQKFDQEDL